MTIKKHILHIDLSDGPLMGDNNNKNNMYGGRLNHETKRLITVNSMYLTSTIS